MQRILMLVLAGLVLGAAGAETYRRLGERTGVIATPATGEAETAEVDLIADGDLQAVAEQLGEAKSGISVAAWKQAHPEDQRPAEVAFEACAAFQWTKQLVNGRTLTRLATFYPPEPPKPLKLPTKEDSASLIDRCTLAWIKVDLGVDGREKLMRSVPKIQAEFTKRMGNPDPELAPFGYPLGSPWHDGDAAVVIRKNTDVNPLLASNTVSNTLRVQWQTKASLVTYAYLPRVPEEKMERARERYEVVSPETSPEIFELAMRTSGIEQADLVRTMNELYRECSQHPPLSANDVSSQEKRTTPGLERGKKVVDALEEWMRVMRELPAQRKAGALLAAYFLLKDATDHLDNSEMEAMRDWLVENKVIVSEKELGPWGPNAKWVKEARDLDPEGPIGDAVTLMAVTNPLEIQDLLPNGYRPVAESEGQKDVTDFVIESGQKYLARSRDPEMAEAVEYFIASAYCDRVQLPGMEQDKPSSWEIQRAAAAKPEAIKYFAMAMAGRSPRAVMAWRSGWRVLAGLPVGFRFYDVGD